MGLENFIIFVKSIYGFVILQISIFMPREMLDGKNLLCHERCKKNMKFSKTRRGVIKKRFYILLTSSPRERSVTCLLFWFRDGEMFPGGDGHTAVTCIAPSTGDTQVVVITECPVDNII